METIYCARCGLGLYWTDSPERPLCGDCRERERGMTREELIDHWRRVEHENAPRRVDGHGITPRHKLVYQARLRLRVLDPQVTVWMRELVRQETGLIVCRWKQYRLGNETARIVI
jgi:hypothetical protein